jgi:hypothetical protein
MPAPTGRPGQVVGYWELTGRRRLRSGWFGVVIAEVERQRWVFAPLYAGHTPANWRQVTEWVRVRAGEIIVPPGPDEEDDMTEPKLHLVTVTSKDGMETAVAAFKEMCAAESFARSYNPDLGATSVSTILSRDVPEYLTARSKLQEPSHG